jgi:radical SAM-linked protein
MAFIRANIPVFYSQGFNPLPKMEIASPLSLGIKASGEIALIETDGYFSAEAFRNSLNDFLPDGYMVTEAMNVFIPVGHKKHSLSSLLWGYVYAGREGEPEMVAAKAEKSYRASRVAESGSNYSLERLSVLAKSQSGSDSYFIVYRALYPDTRNPH